MSVQRRLWHPPDAGALKINFDAVVRENRLCAAAVCRNFQGDILCIRLAHHQGSSPLKGEAQAARLALLVAQEFANPEIYFEGDSKYLVN